MNYLFTAKKDDKDTTDEEFSDITASILRSASTDESPKTPEPAHEPYQYMTALPQAQDMANSAQQSDGDTLMDINRPPPITVPQTQSQAQPQAQAPIVITKTRQQNIEEIADELGYDPLDAEFLDLFSWINIQNKFEDLSNEIEAKRKKMDSLQKLAKYLPKEIADKAKAKPKARVDDDAYCSALAEAVSTLERDQRIVFPTCEFCQYPVCVFEQIGTEKGIDNLCENGHRCTYCHGDHSNMDQRADYITYDDQGQRVYYRDAADTEPTVISGPCKK